MGRPLTIYEAHLNSWMGLPFGERVEKLCDYAHHMGFTHVEAMWDQPAPPRDEFGHLADRLHAHGIGVILDGPARPGEYPADAFRGDFAWNTDWAREVLEYMSLDPIHRSHRHELILGTNRLFIGDFVLPLSHREGSLIARMPGDEWRRFANLRVLYGYMFASPGRKLLFMGHEFGQWREWSREDSLDWHLLDQPPHKGLQRWVRDLNTFYRGRPALYELDAEPAGFDWIEHDDRERSVAAFRRRSGNPRQDIVFVCNFTPVPRHNYRLGVPRGDRWEELLNGDAALYGGSGQGNGGGVEAAPVPMHGHPYSLNLTLPPLAMIALGMP